MKSRIVFHMPRLSPALIMLVPLTLVGIQITGYLATKGDTSTTSTEIWQAVAVDVIAFCLFALVAMLYFLPEIEINNGRLRVRNAVGRKSLAVDLDSLISAKARRVIVGRILVRIWQIELIDKNNNTVRLSLSTWKNEKLLKGILYDKIITSGIEPEYNIIGELGSRF